MIALDKVVAIDVHAHVEVGRHGEDGLRPEWREAAARYFGEAPARRRRCRRLLPRAQHGGRRLLRRRRNGHGQPRLSNDEVVEAAAANADVLIPFASIDPHRQARRPGASG